MVTTSATIVKRELSPSKRYSGALSDCEFHEVANESTRGRRSQGASPRSLGRWTERRCLSQLRTLSIRSRDSPRHSCRRMRTSRTAQARGGIEHDHSRILPHVWYARYVGRVAHPGQPTERVARCEPVINSGWAFPLFPIPIDWPGVSNSLELGVWE
jgi:hypothetical protein